MTRERLGRELADRSERTQRDLDVLLADNRAHVDSIWVRAKGGGTRAVEGLRAGPALPQPSPIEDLGVALRSRELSRPRFAQLLKDVGGYPKVLSKTTIAFWCEGTDEPDPAALRAMAAVLAKLPPLEHPRTLSLKPLTDAELDEAVVTAVYLLPGRIKTQLTKSLPQGETRRRLQAVDRMAAAGRIIGRLGHTPPDALGRVFERTCYWPPDAKEAFASPDSKGLTAHVDLAAELRRRGLSARTFASLLTDRGYTISRGAAERWCKKSLLLDPEAQSAIDALLAEIPPLKNPLPLSAKPITDAELDGAVVVGVLKDPGRTKTQVAGSLPQGASQRRLAAVDRMAKAGRIVPRRGVAPPNAGGKVLAHDYYWPPGDIELTTNLTTTAAD